MKKRKARARAQALDPAELTSNFARGVVAVGLLTAIQDRWTVGKPPSRKVVRMALQGGIALAAGVATAESLRDRDYLGAVAAFAGGAVGVLALETLLTSELSQSHETAEESDIG